MEKMTKTALQNVLTQKGISFTKSMTKPELIKALESTDKKPKEGRKFDGEY